MHEGLAEQATLICPRCRRPGAESSLELGRVLTRDGDFVLEGFLVCSSSTCGMAYPILDGVPVVLKNIEAWWAAERPKLSSVSCDAAEMGAYFKELGRGDVDRYAARCLLGTYMDVHYGALDGAPSALAAWAGGFWERVIEMARPERAARYGHALDLGCSVGRYTFELARLSELAVGMDLSFDAVAAAAGCQRTRTVAYGRRTHGFCFETVRSSYVPPQNVLFLVGDVLEPPFAAESFDLVAGLNLLDNVKLPLVALGQMDALLRPGGDLVLCSPYEWRTDICESAEWLEGEAVDAPATVRGILEGTYFPQMGLTYHVLRESEDVPWVLRHHVRYWSAFALHALRARKGAV